MANKYFRQNLRNGTPRKSNIAKIMETFGTKKKVKKPKKRMFANKGGGADSGRMGEIKSKLAVAGMKAKDVMGKKTGGLTKEQIEKIYNNDFAFGGGILFSAFGFNLRTGIGYCPTLEDKEIRINIILGKSFSFETADIQVSFPSYRPFT